MNDYGLRDIFKHDFEQLHLKFFQLERMIEVGAYGGYKPGLKQVGVIFGWWPGSQLDLWGEGVSSLVP